MGTSQSLLRAMGSGPESPGRPTVKPPKTTDIIK